MGRILLVLFMQTSLMVCPFDCMGRATDGIGVPTAGDKGPCCPHCRSESEQPADSPAEDPGCDCICCGAVLAEVASVIPEASVSWGVLTVRENASVGAILVASRHNRDATLGHMQGGRSRHLRWHSWLI